jgi:hypothetical protein
MFFLAHDKHKFVYEICPDLFGNTLTPEECEYWTAFSVLQQAEMYEVSPKIHDVFEVIEEINYKISERKKELAKRTLDATNR